MKNVRNNSAKQNKGMSRIPKLEIRDNLDSRVNEEQNDKGSDVTHNHKETKQDKHHQH